jgi:hypothetical protein
MGTRIGQVRIRANTDDALATRMRGEAALRSLDLEPPSMPARMTLCIRSMPDPMPGGVDLRSAHSPRPTEWERAARNAVNDALHRAVRPARGIVPIDADAVLFSDHAELLACAARDAGNGFLAAWWWPHLLRATNVAGVVYEWQRHPQYIAAAMELLAQSGDVVEFVQKVAPHSAADLLMQVLAAHDLAATATEVVHLLAATEPPAVTTKPLPAQLAIAGLLEPGITIEQRLFALVTLGIRRTPSLLRTAENARALIRTIAQPQTSRAEKPADASHAKSRPEERTIRSAAAEAEATPSPARLSDHRPAEAHESQTTSNQQPATPQRAKHPDTTEPQPNDTYPEPASSQTPDARRPTPASHPQPPTAQSPTPIAFPDTIATRHAGLFFLLNVATALGLYDPYGRETPIALDVWDFLALTGRVLVPELVEDDLWPLLTMLANRETDDDLPELDDDLLTRVREALALVIEDHDPAAFVINQPGHIAVSPAHLDVTFCLAAHPIELRIAGLDRAPGWIPAAGRHVEFHFD